MQSNCTTPVQGQRDRLRCGIRWVCVFTISVATAYGSEIYPANAKLLGVDGFLATQTLHNIEVSPSLDLVAVTVSRPRVVGDNYRPQTSENLSVPLRNDLRIISIVDGSTVFEIDGLATGSTVFASKWSPDGTKLAYLRANRSGEIALAIWDAPSRRENILVAKNVRPVPLIRSPLHENEVSPFAWVGSGGIAYTGAGEFSLGSAQRLIESAEIGKVSARDWDSKNIPLCRQNDTLRIVEVENSTLTTIAQGSIVGASISPTGKKIIAVVATSHLTPPRNSPLRYPPRNSSLGDFTPFISWKSSVFSYKKRQWTRSKNSITGKGVVGSETMPRWSPDGSEWMAMSVNDPFAFEPGAILTKARSEGSIIQKVEFNSRMDAIRDLSSFELGRAVDDNMAHEDTSVQSGERSKGNATSIGETASGFRLVRIHQSGVTALRAMSGTKETNLLELNKHLENVGYPKPIPIYYHSNGGQRSGWLIIPEGASKRPPVVVYGYPLTTAWTPSIMEPEAGQVILHRLLAKGIAIFIADFRIESPLETPDEPVDRITSEIGSAVHALKESALIDVDRIAFYGHSFGAFTALTLLSHSSEFRAIVAAAPLGDLISYSFKGEKRFDQQCGAAQILVKQMAHEDPGSAESPIDSNMIMRMGTPPYGDVQKYVRNSPIFNLENAVTPTLIIQGEYDDFSDGERVFNTLYRLGVESRLLYYWGEGHTIDGPENVRDMTVQTTDWIADHLLMRH